MDIKRLTHFIALAEERRFVAAAARMHLSQAAFSRSIQALEDQLGLRLFDHGPQGVALTQMGETVLQRAKALVFESRCLDRDIETLARKGSVTAEALRDYGIARISISPELLGRVASVLGFASHKN
jgi:DNA-binding transcriptional LysR family regulator